MSNSNLSACFHDMLEAMTTLLGSSRVRTDEASLSLLACDALHSSRLPAGTGPARPLCVVEPRSTVEVQEVVRLANTHRVPVIPLGGGSGLMGGAFSVTPAVVIDACRLAEVCIRPEDRMAEAGAGATIAELNAAAEPYGLMCGHDPWTVSVATVGGTIATNSLGYLGGKYGSMGDQVLGLEAVLPNGEAVVTRAVEKASTGPGLHRLFIGAEGCFGVVTRATLRLFPVPPARLLEGWEFDDFTTGFEAIQGLLNAAVRPGLLEFGDDDPNADHDPPASLYLSYEGPEAIARAEAQIGQDVCRQGGGRLLHPSEVQNFWNQRHASGDAYASARRAGHRRGRPEIDYVHVALPPGAVLRYRRESLNLLASGGFHVHQTGLWGHAGLFSLVYSGGNMADTLKVHQRLLEMAQDAGGAMEYCHGVGLRLAPLMDREHGSGLGVLRRLKRELDPNAVMNPGKLGL